MKVVRLDEYNPEVACAKSELKRFDEDRRFFGKIYEKLM